ncbi:MAG: ExbD/TolR family protein, partial [Candidatus Binatia bacterium]
VDIQGLTDRFRMVAQSNPQTQILIQADERVPHGKVVQVMDLARTSGLQRLAIVTQRRSNQRR